MRSLSSIPDFRRKTSIGGVLFLLPVIVIVILIHKAVQIAAEAGHKLTGVFAPPGIGPWPLAIAASVIRHCATGGPRAHGRCTNRPDGQTALFRFAQAARIGLTETDEYE